MSDGSAAEKREQAEEKAVTPASPAAGSTDIPTVRLQGASADRFSLINRKNVNCRHYTRTLVSEALRVGLLPIEIVDDIQMQMMGKLEELLREYKKATGTEPDEDGAKHMLESVFYTVDVYLMGYHDPMYAITAVQATDIEEMFRGGRQQIRTLICEAVSLYVQAKKTRIPTVNLTYDLVLDEDIKAFLTAYDYRYAAQDNVVTLRYPLAYEGGSGCTGIHHLREYLRRLCIENRIMQLFDPEERDLLFASYAEAHGGKPETMRVNLLTLILRNGFGASILGKYTGILTLTEDEVSVLYAKLHRKTTRELEEMSSSAVNMMLSDFHIRDGAVTGYIRRAGIRFSRSLAEARNAGESADLFVASDPLHLFRQ